MKCLALLLCLPMLALANFEACSNGIAQVEDRPIFPPMNETGYRRYSYTTDVNGICNSVDLTCVAEFPRGNEDLRGRSWYITENKIADGITYGASSMQLYNVQCPTGTYLHLLPQMLQTESPAPGADCLSADFVRVINPELLGGEEVMCGDDEDIRQTDLYNGGLGTVFTNGNAAIEFCSNPNLDVGIPPDTDAGDLNNGQVFTGFVIRATCVEPTDQLQGNCVTFDFVRLWDPEWLNQQNDPYEKPLTLDVPHKRSAETPKFSRAKFLKTILKHEGANRMVKRFVSQQKIEFSAGQTVTYINGRFAFNFNNGSTIFVPDGQFSCVDTVSDFLGSRKFFGSTPNNFVFTGPGVLELDQNRAVLQYTINTTDAGAVSSVLLPSPDVMQRINLINEYIFCWVGAYPVVDNFPRSSTRPVYPLPRAEFVDVFLDQSRRMFGEILGEEGAAVMFGRIKASRHLGFLQEDFWPIADRSFDDTCYRGALIRAAPNAEGTVPRRISDFCRLFIFSCDTMLRITCRELLRLDPVGAQG
ncbi:uncharacterized protein LOC135336854 [Halichondria panicea]|uniref:uncharacterized protein LOC135336854 n=1 Tax=Halichondria panicea TaxID=6063 RepID=UPI00312BA8A2